ncbi:MAG TPA: histidinol-phosphate transaminase [Thermodesulfovibrionia bacterium]|nr:histidinol-phosphate transaminase [Thermodesulfovibrionia bacterium]
MFKPHIREMKEYKPPLEGRTSKEYLLLDFNERTIPVSSKIKRAIIDFVKSDKVQMYPSYGNLTERLAQYAGVQKQQVMITNGSDQGIDIIIRALCREKDEIIIPKPSFAMYWQCAFVENLTIVEPPYTKERGFPTEEVLNAINTKTRLIIIPNPNNPTGTSVSVDDIVNIAQNAPHTALLVDECYFEYTKLTVKDYIEQYKNIFITRTFSKTWGLPSVRLGYILTTQDNIRQLLKVRGPYDMNMFAVTAVHAALDDPSYMQEYVEEILHQSKPVLEKFLLSKGVDFWPSNANFIFTLPQNQETVYKKLEQYDILVRPRNDAQGNSGLRITIGTLKQTERLIKVLEQVL